LNDEDLTNEDDVFEHARKTLGYGEGKYAIQKAEGLNESEKKLANLAEGSFLSLWSYPNLFIDKGDGKELCDLLVIFGDHVLIFSDKSIDYPDNADENIAWKRWYKRAVRKSANQIYGAERWLREHPDRIFLDPNCEQKLPLPLPNPDKMIIHRIAVAHGAKEACKTKFGGTGSLILNTNVTDDSELFSIGTIDPQKGFIHVFDDVNLDIVLQHLDTTIDLINYLTKKEALINRLRLLVATSEEDLLAYYLTNINESEEHDFVIDEDTNILMVDESWWEDFKTHPRKLAQEQDNQISYTWDRLIEAFIKHLMDDTQYYTNTPGVIQSEKTFRLMAEESRFRRRLLSSIFYRLINKTPSTEMGATVIPGAKPNQYYVFLLVPRGQSETEEQYRQIRYGFLEAYCLVTKLIHPDALDIVGIATESGVPEVLSEDSMYFDAREWTPELEEEAKGLQEEYNILKEINTFQAKMSEYPQAQKNNSKTSLPPRIPMKGRDRNKPCPCGSGKKIKKCCGKK